MKLVKSDRQGWRQLRKACDLEVNYARKREPGHWELAAVAFVTSGHVDVRPWWDEATDENLWRECGFPKRPPYKRTWERLRELESVCAAFLDAAEPVIRRCRAHDPRVFAHSHVDSTEDETHASLVHDCKPGESCKRAAAAKHSNGKGKGRGKRVRGHAIRPARATTSEAREHRHAWNELDQQDTEDHERKASPDQIVEVKGTGRWRVRLGGCWYLTRDGDAGVRAYTRNGKTKRFWFGYYSGKMVDHYTGGVIPLVVSASVNESKMFPKLFDRAKSMIGAAPQTVIGDKGFSVSECFEHATKNGTAPVFPWRGITRHDKDTHDRHGLMRCKHCGGPMSQVKFSACKDKLDPLDPNKTKPRLWFRCVDGTVTPGCAKPQTITCAKDWRLLVPLARTEPLYQELRASHQAYEGVHDYFRDRYRVAADSRANRPKAVGIGWHQLRANIACYVDWLRIAANNGWQGSTRDLQRHGCAPEQGQVVRRCEQDGKNAASRLKKFRAAAGLMSRYGQAAKRLGLGDETPPSRRPRGAPPPAPPSARKP
ncbi:MAG TPA: transposase [Solirubrobacteraceae bacterium]|nr:transposase [Solirubrobacteraceae bacterium]